MGLLRAKIGAILTGMIVMSAVPWLIEQRNLVQETRQREAYLHQLRSGPISNIVKFGPFLATEAVLSKGGLSQTSFTRTSSADIPATRRVKLFAQCNDNQVYTLGVSEPQDITIEKGDNTLNISYNVNDFGFRAMLERGIDYSNCSFYWSKIFTMHLAAGIDRVAELHSNAFRILEE